MRNPSRALRLLVAAVALQAVLSVPAGPTAAAPAFAPAAWTAPTLGSGRSAPYGSFPLQFIPNRGQMDRRVDYYVQGLDKSIYFTAGGLTYVFRGGRERRNASLRWIVKLEFRGADPGVKAEALEGSGTIVSYFKGVHNSPSAGLRACSKIVYRDLWPGIDLVYSGTFDRMKYEFEVRPGADPSRIGFIYRGAESLSLDRDGRLRIQTPAGGFEDEPPVAFQEIEGARVPVAAAFGLEDGAAGEARLCGFRVGPYDRSRPLVLDPSSLVYCGFIGGSWLDSGQAIAVDAAGCAYVAGSADLLDEDFPVTVGPDLSYNGGYTDAFVAKVNASGTGLDYCGFIGGSGDDTATGIAVDAGGNAYVSGYTDSPAATFPLLVGPTLERKQYVDGFVAKIDPSGTALLYCGYIGGAMEDYALAIAVDGTGSAYVAGATTSTETSFPVTVGPSTAVKGGQDGFVAKIVPSGASFAYCGFVGGSGDDSARGIAVDALGSAYLTGSTIRGFDDQGNPLPPDFPAVVGPDLTWNGLRDAFAAKVDPTGSSFVYSGYLGGSANEIGYGIAVDTGGNAYITGTTSSSESSFPVTVGPDLTHNGTGYPGEEDGFVAKVATDGAALVYCGYVGGSGRDSGAAIAVDGEGCAYVTGKTDSRSDTFPVTVGPSLVSKDRAWTSDVYVAKVSVTGEVLAYCGYISGATAEDGRAIAVDGSGHAYITGETSTSDGYWGFFPAIVGPDLTFNGGRDAFVAKIEAVPAVSAPELISLTPDQAGAGAQSLTVDISGTDFVEGAHVFCDGLYMPTTFLDASSLRTEITGDILRSGRVAQVTVRNPDGQVTNALPVTVINPVPSISHLSPTYHTSGSGDGSIIVRGANFVPTSIVRWNGAAGDSWYTGGDWINTAVPADLFAAGGEFQVTVENPAPGGGTSNAIVFPVSIFTLTPTPTSATVSAGASATYTVLLKPQFASFDGTVTFACQGLPKDCTGSFFPETTMPGTNWLETVLTLKTKAPSGAAAGLAAGAAGPLAAALGVVLIAGAAIAGADSRRIVGRSSSRLAAAACALAFLALILVACGAGGGGDDHQPTGGTPAGTYNITVNATSGALTVATVVTLVVR